MDTDKCAALLCVLESGSITAAAEKLGYTVSGISRMMASLEAESGFPLLLRSKNGVVPTEDCRRMLPTLQELARLGALYEARSSAVRGLDTGVIRVGSVYGAYYPWLAQTIAAFSKSHPGIEVRFLQGSSSEFYAQHPLLAWLPRNHPCVKNGIYPLRNFETDPYIDTFPGQETDNSRAFRANGIAPHSHFLSKDVQATHAMIAAGLGVALNNAILAYGLDLSDIITLPTDPPVEVEIGIAAPRKEDRSPAAEHFLKYALDHLPD